MSRPTKEAEPGTQVTVSLRVRAELKTRLEERAAASHRNLSQECERALTRSFDPQALFRDAANLLPPLEWDTAGRHLHEMLRAHYGENIAKFGYGLMEELASAVLSERAGKRHRIARSMIDYYKAAAEVLEQTSEVIEQEPGKATPEWTDVMRDQDRRPEGRLRNYLGVSKSVIALRDAMCSRIASGEWKASAAIPSETDLAREFGVSQETMRGALDLMEAQGLLERRPGKGAPSKKATLLFFPSSPSAARSA